MTNRPDPSEYGVYYGRYIDRVPDGPLVETLRQQVGETTALLRSLDPALGEHRYAPGKWTLAESVAHVIDTERIFGVRALRIARGDETPLPGYDQDAYVAALDLFGRTLADLAGELERVRASTIDLFASLSETALARVGTASANPLSARAAGWIIAGHEQHHVALIQERYLA